MVRPEQHHAVARPVDGLERVGRRPGDAGGVERHVAEAGAQVLGEVVAGGPVLRVAEDGDVGVEGFEVLAGVLGRVSAWCSSGYVLCGTYGGVHYVAGSG